MSLFNSCKPYRFKSNGTAKNGVIKATPGFVFSFAGGCTDATPVYFRLYDMATAPATSDTPVAEFVLPGNATGATADPVFSKPLEFTTGIAFRCVTDAADNGDTATSSNEVIVTIGYR